jgi:hypothetical protein
MCGYLCLATRMFASYLTKRQKLVPWEPIYAIYIMKNEQNTSKVQTQIIVKYAVYAICKTIKRKVKHTQHTKIYRIQIS